ncbi:4-hydroxy-tetrahydrodipicolinate reductase [Myroides sp. LJL119]
MKIALLGYGKMGQIIQKIALERGHEIVLTKDSKSSFDGLQNADVAIDFSLPKVAVENIKSALDLNIPVISGTTGWLEHYDQIVDYTKQKDSAFLYASNFSIGVNIFFELNAYLAKMIKDLPDYKVSMQEIHHTQKLDAPSGTAITLAQGIINNSNQYNEWTLDTPESNQIQIDAIRQADVPGTHVVNYDSVIDQIQIKHTANNREGFALGAIVAAEWILGKKGIFSMNDVLNIKK